MLPNSLLDHWNGVVDFMIRRVQPTFALSGGVSQAVSMPFKNKFASEEQKKEEERKCLEAYGVSLDVKEEINKAVFKYGFVENTEGGNDEARMLLKSVKGLSWGAFEDYEVCVAALAETWDKKVGEGARPLSISVALPEEDMMIGDKGMQYFENVWREENRGKGIQVEVIRWKGTDHETAVDASSGGMGKMFELVKGLRSLGSETEDGGP